MAETHHNEHLPAAHGGHEKTDVDILPLVRFAAGLLVFTILIAFLISWLFGVYSASAARADAPASPLEALRQPPPLPRLQVGPTTDMKALRKEEDAVLKGYAWIVREAGLVRIPIERAKELTLQRALPARPETPAGPGQQP